jgi:probable HAF family extracellular repeat protein
MLKTMMIVALFLATSTLTHGQHSTPRYTVQDLGTLGGSTSNALGINDRGDVVGQATTETGDHHAFLFADGVMRDLGTSVGGSATRGRLMHAATSLDFTSSPTSPAPFSIDAATASCSRSRASVTISQWRTVQTAVVM